jgi:chemotaxis protein CheX
MKAQYINSFYKAVLDVFKLMLDINPEREELAVVDDMITGNEANVMIGITGDLAGSVLFGFTKDMTLEMVKIMSGMEMKKLDSFVSSALGEVVNIISGNAVTNLSKEGYTCDISPPQVIIGENRSISMATEKALTLPIKTEIGKFEINISVRENQ